MKYEIIIVHSNGVFFRNNIKFENLTIKQKQVWNYQRLIEGNVQYTNKSTTKYEEIVFTHNTQGSLGTLNENTISKTLEVNTIIKKFHLVPKYPVQCNQVDQGRKFQLPSYCHQEWNWNCSEYLFTSYFYLLTHRPNSNCLRTKAVLLRLSFTTKPPNFKLYFFKAYRSQ